jgi:uncharacterized protein YjbI with pentapeptide repeats
MLGFDYDDDKRRWLHDRWDGDVINHLVIALNEGREIASILAEVPKDKTIPARRDVLDLRGIDFSHQNLRGPWKRKGEERSRTGILLRGADLTGADMSWAILPRADFRGSFLKEADFRNAELIYADFSETDLSDARFDGAWLLDTRFYDAKVTEEQLHRRRNLGQLDFDYHAYEI